ncbi:unnamed protein product, partial [Mesorhabditis belari]|uniref:Uncharacterized protein n=1 Tax=Mesorhabditis belari TaxID=2138241 RepID=A0AAF3EX74_9BILA
MSLSASFWQRFNEPIIALILSSVLFALYVSIDSYTEFQDWQTGVDNHSDLSANETEQLTITLEYAFLAVSFLPCLLAASENGNKLIYVLLYIISFPCNPEFSSLKCSTGLQNATAAPFSFVDDYGLYDIAQYCQFFISLR